MRYLLILFILSSCSAQWHIQKAIKKDPSVLKVDTLTVIDTVTITTPQVTTDTIFKLSSDTVTIQKDRLTIKHYYQSDSIYIWGDCASDTIIQYKEIKVPFAQVVYKEKFIPNWVWFVLVVVVLILIIRKYLL